MTATQFGLALKKLRPNIQDKQRTYNGTAGTWVYLGIGLKVKEEER